MRIKSVNHHLNVSDKGFIEFLEHKNIENKIFIKNHKAH